MIKLSLYGKGVKIMITGFALQLLDYVLSVAPALVDIVLKLI